MIAILAARDRLALRGPSGPVLQDTMNYQFEMPRLLALLQALAAKAGVQAVAAPAVRILAGEHETSRVVQAVREVLYLA